MSTASDDDRASNAELLQSLVADQTARLRAHDDGVRSGHPGSVHQLRIVARRLRSTVTTFGEVVVGPDPAVLRQELRWLGGSLGQARDAQVLRGHLLTMLWTEPPELVLGPVAERIDRDLEAARRAGLDHAHQALASQRYADLIDALHSLATVPTLTHQAESRARDGLPSLLQRDLRHLRRAVRAAARTETRAERDRALHQVRKKAKRLRYAAESAAPLLGTRAKQLARSSKAVQDVLGEHQDAVVAQSWLREYAVRAAVKGENSFTYGRLHALEQERADRAEQRFVALWGTKRSKKVRRRVREMS
ncbi:MAG: CHAD domain-containing protein [Terracoccus sp.]